MTLINGVVTMQGLTVANIDTEEQLLELVALTSSKRKTSSTILNDTSSRSHAVFTIQLT